MERKHQTQTSNNIDSCENPSLADKFKTHYKNTKSKNFHQRVEAWTQFMIKLPLPVPFLLSTALVTWYNGVTRVAPELYGDYGLSVYYSQVLFGTFLVWQMFIFWCATRLVDSSFKPSKLTIRKINPLPSTTNGGTTRLYLGTKNSSVAKDDLFRGRCHEDDDNKQVSISESYLLPGYCLICNDVKPPRCHHCVVCDVCVLKRDHHCYFTGSCVGWRNHRYFIVFCFWATFGSTYASVHLFYFIYKTVWTSMSSVDIFAPFALLRCIMGSTSLPVLVYVCLTSSHLYCVLLGTKFVVEHLFLITKGLTTYENNPKRKELRVFDTVKEKFRSVFGEYSLINLLVPTHFFFPPIEDPVNWPTLKTF